MKIFCEDSLHDALFAMQDTDYRDFHARLIPNVSRERIIGIRVPTLRKFARQFARTPDAALFLNALPHFYYEENNLHAFLIEQMTDFTQTVAALDVFLPYVDNWATCDSMRPTVFYGHLQELQCKIREWLDSPYPYAVRFGIEMLMVHFLDEHFSSEYVEWVAAVQSEEYYIRMMVAWYFATALAKQYDAVLPFLTQRRLEPWTHNKTIQKAIESFRITPEQKNFLRSLKV